jgi:hypothetical protein
VHYLTRAPKSLKARSSASRALRKARSISKRALSVRARSASALLLARDSSGLAASAVGGDEAAPQEQKDSGDARLRSDEAAAQRLVPAGSSATVAASAAAWPVEHAVRVGSAETLYTVAPARAEEGRSDDRRCRRREAGG